MTTDLERALKAWASWYSARLDRIAKQLERGEPHEDYTGYEQDLFEALGCPGNEDA
jgi:hypothetical protein